ncbi:MAG: zinc metallopeptidase [Bacillota bacterium]|nr:zinc metallopeptidase [Bacillota bacterium]
MDIYYIILVIPCIILVLWAQIKVKTTFRKYSRMQSRRGLTGAQAAQRVLRAGGVTDVRIEWVGGTLTDHFDPRTKVIRLSDSVYGATTVAAAGVAAHEAGHAVQYAENYLPVKIRSAIIPITNLGSNLAWPVIFLGLILNFPSLFGIGILLFALVAVFQLVTLPVEFNASRRAVAALSDGGLLDEDELRGARKTLSAAALTYVAALALSVAELLRLLLIFGGRRD